MFSEFVEISDIFTDGNSAVSISFGIWDGRAGVGLILVTSQFKELQEISFSLLFIGFVSSVKSAFLQKQHIPANIKVVIKKRKAKIIGSSSPIFYITFMVTFSIC